MPCLQFSISTGDILLMNLHKFGENKITITNNSPPLFHLKKGHLNWRVFTKYTKLLI